MKAWLVQWDWQNDAAAVADRVVAILNPRKSSQTVADIVEFLYVQFTADLTGQAAYARRRANMPCRAKISSSGQIFCGRNPWLFAELVSDLKITIDPETSIETLSWLTQPVHVLTKQGYKLVIPPNPVTFKRLITGSVSHELMWDRSKNQFKDKFLSKL